MVTLYKNDRFFETSETQLRATRDDDPRLIYIESKSRFCGAESMDMCEKERFLSNFNHEEAACNTAELGHDRRPTGAVSTQN